MTYNVLMGTLNPTHSLTHSLHLTLHTHYITFTVHRCSLFHSASDSIHSPLTCFTSVLITGLHLAGIGCTAFLHRQTCLTKLIFFAYFVISLLFILNRRESYVIKLVRVCLCVYMCLYLFVCKRYY